MLVLGVAAVGINRPFDLNTLVVFSMGRCYIIRIGPFAVHVHHCRGVVTVDNSLYIRVGSRFSTISLLVVTEDLAE